MKISLPAMLALLVTSSAWAQNFQVVYSPTLKLEIYIDDVENSKPESWCANSIPLRIVAGGDKKPSVLNGFLPRVGDLMAKQCPHLTTLPWQITDKDGHRLSRGTAYRSKKWMPEVLETAPVAAPVAPLNEMSAPVQPVQQVQSVQPIQPVQPAEAVRPSSPMADSSAWQQFDLPDGCHFRTYWSSGSASTLFVPATTSTQCGSDGWLNGQSQLNFGGQSGNQLINVTFFAGFPLTGLKGLSGSSDIQITSVNNQRMILANTNLPHSWLILPYNPQSHSWNFQGTMVIQVTPSDMADSAQLKQHEQDASKNWAVHLTNDKLNIMLVNSLHAELENPAIDSARNAQ
jgi:hypothetical protein